MISDFNNSSLQDMLAREPNGTSAISHLQESLERHYRLLMELFLTIICLKSAAVETRRMTWNALTILIGSAGVLDDKKLKLADVDRIFIMVCR